MLLIDKLLKVCDERKHWQLAKRIKDKDLIGKMKLGGIRWTNWIAIADDAEQTGKSYASFR